MTGRLGVLYPQRMTHTEALNLILSHACPANYNKETKVNTYLIDVHCQTIRVDAILTGTVPTITYDVLSVTNA